MLRRLLIVALLWVVADTVSVAQALPLAPAKVSVSSTGSTGGSSSWRVGPILLELPKTWTNTSTDLIARLSGPTTSVATFVMLQATPEAIAAGYSLLLDPGRGPHVFVNFLLWDDCVGSPARTAVTLPASSGVKAFYASCTVELQPGTTGLYVQASFYTQGRLVQMHAVGLEPAMRGLVKSLSNYRWQDET